MIVQHNMLAENTSRQIGKVTRTNVSSMEKLTTGYRVNRAADDAAGLSISEKLRGQIKGLNRGTQNVEEAIGLCNIADGALTEVHDMIHRIRELSVQAANDTYVDEDRADINMEIELIKREINRISKDTEYNTIPIFNTGTTLDFSSSLTGVRIWDVTDGANVSQALSGSYNPSLAALDVPDNYGGIIVTTVSGNQRISWQDISGSNGPMYDAGTGTFNEGEYTYTAPDGTELTFVCEDGATPPDISMKIAVSADETRGVKVGGEWIPWSNIVNEDGESILDHIGEDGYYMFQLGKGEGGFYAEAWNDLADLADDINSQDKKLTRTYESTYNGAYIEKGVDITGTRITGNADKKKVDISVLAGNFSGSDKRLGADANGIYILTLDANGNYVKDVSSVKSWNSMGIDWGAGSGIGGDYVYSYNGIQIEFSLLDETDLEAVIQGLNGAEINKPDASGVQWEVNNNKTADIDIGRSGSKSGVSAGTLSSATKNDITVEQEQRLGRDFTTPMQTGSFAESQLTYDAASNTFVLQYDDASGSPVLTYTFATDSSAEAKKDNIVGKVKTASSRLIGQAIKEELNSKYKDMLGVNAKYPDLTSVLGTNKINPSSGKLMNSGGLNVKAWDDAGLLIHTGTPAKNSYEGWVKSQLGNDHSYSTIDFSDLNKNNKYDLYDLIGHGFNSTCCSCRQHYSVVFSYGDSTTKTTSGYGYSMTKEWVPATGKYNYTLSVDLKDFIDKQTSTQVNYDGASFTQALIEIFSEAGDFDQHYTQYAVKRKATGQPTDGILYIMDNRSGPSYYPDESVGQGIFDTQPFQLEKMTVPIVLREQSNNANMISLSYTIDPNDFLTPFAETEVDQATQKVTGVKAGLQYTDNNGVAQQLFVNDPQFWEIYYDILMENIAKTTKISLNATNYDYYAMNGITEENPNSAVVSDFENMSKPHRNFWIQSGANSFQGINMNWDTFSTFKLGLQFKDTLTQENAEEMIDAIDKALWKISSLRSTFGAYTNRFYHAQAYNENAAENMQTAESKIRDTDMADEMVSHAKNEILIQAGQSMLVQSNNVTQGVLQLLR